MIAYIVNQYPKVSHAFIRREILAVEKGGTAVFRFALRGWDAELVDETDIAERERTTYILRSGGWPLLRATLDLMVRRPASFIRALRLTAHMARGSDRSVALHAVTLCEACYMARTIADAKVRHIHAHFGTNSAEVAMLASALTGIPYSFTVHGPDEFDKPQFTKLRTKIERSKFVVAISHFGASQLFRWVEPRHWHKVKIVRCGVERDYGCDERQQQPNPDRLVCVGRISTQKGHRLLVEAAAKVMRERSNFQLVIVGDGELRPEIEAFIAKEGLQRRLRITGWATGEQVRSEILQSRGLILTSFAEGLPVVVMEAMALGRIVLATHIAGIPELVRPGETGWLFSPGSAAAAADAIRACLSATAERCKEMGECGRSLVHQRHDVDRETAFLCQLFASDANNLPERQSDADNPAERKAA